MIIVTGAAGFIGSNLVSYLNSKGIDNILAVDDLGSKDKWNNLLGLNFKDLLSIDQFIDFINCSKNEDITALVHLGASSSTTERDGDYLHDINYSYTKLLANWSLENKIRFIYASSAATYGDGKLGFRDDHQELNTLKPLNAYGFSKYLFDLYALNNNLLDSIAGIKFFNVYGEREEYKEDQASVVFKSFKKILKDSSMELFKSTDPKIKDGEQKRDFVYVGDCVKVIHWLIENKNINGIFNLGTGKAQTFYELTSAVFKALNINESIKYIDMPAELKSKYQNFTQADITKLRAAGYNEDFADLNSGVAKTISWYQKKS